LSAIFDASSVDDDDALALVVEAGERFGVVLGPRHGVGAPALFVPGTIENIPVLVTFHQSRVIERLRHLTISGQSLVRICGSVLAVTTTRVSSCVSSAQQTIMPMSADLPMP
jgi:hypothetical protein